MAESLALLAMTREQLDDAMPKRKKTPRSGDATTAVAAVDQGGTVAAVAVANGVVVEGAVVEGGDDNESGGAVAAAAPPLPPDEHASPAATRVDTAPLTARLSELAESLQRRDALVLEHQRACNAEVMRLRRNGTRRNYPRDVRSRCAPCHPQRTKNKRRRRPTKLRPAAPLLVTLR